jgi:peptide/nickel transport system substrate-binding protein
MSGGLAHRLGTRIAALLGSVILAASAGLLVTPPAVMRPALAAGMAGGQVTVAEPTPPDTFDPIAHSDFNNWLVWQLAYETLVVVQPDGKVAPMLATSWKVSPDGLTYVFTLRPGVKFHNGSPLTADDVAFTFERLMAKGIPYAKARFPNVASVTAIDPGTVQIQLKKNDSSFLNNLGDPFAVAGAILSRQAAQTTDPATKMIGTGPFRMVSYVPGSQLNLERNPEYWQPGVPRADRLVIRYIPEAQSAVAALLSGAVGLSYPTPATIVALKRVQGLRVITVASSSTFQINMGSVRPPLDNVNVRRAIASSIDRSAIVKLAFLGEGVPTGPFPPGHPWAVPLAQQPNYQRDVAKAKQLLTQAGYASGVDLTFMWPTLGDTWPRIAQVLQSQLAESGIRLKLQQLETNVWLDRLVKANYDLTMTNAPYFSDPSLYIVPRAGRQGPTPAELQALLDRATQASFNQLPGIYRQIQITEANLVYPFTGVVAENKWVAYLPRQVEGVTFDFTSSRRFYFAVRQPAR